MRPMTQPRGPTAVPETTVNPDTFKIDPSNHRLRRVGHLARQRMRIDQPLLRNGVHADGHLSVEISGLAEDSHEDASRTAVTFDWRADRPVALVIVRSGTDGNDVSFVTGPIAAGSLAIASEPGDGSAAYIAFCYDVETETPATRSSVDRLGQARSVLLRALRSGSAARATR